MDQFDNRRCVSPNTHFAQAPLSELSRLTWTANPNTLLVHRHHIVVGQASQLVSDLNPSHCTRQKLHLWLCKFSLRFSLSFSLYSTTSHQLTNQEHSS
ncbi:hypothetical protein RIF29_35670 [Crotalaria pallida]|uniref:Uncharacterized protein n=1 Tax=Crotalaria pallida TaxID=3830 RepID=A0AAN9EA75_CROPI